MTPDPEQDGTDLVRADRLDPREIARVCAGEWLVQPTAPILGAAIDSRDVGPGMLFFALPGEQTDGHAFLGAASDRGAGAVVVTRPMDELADQLGAAPAVGVLRVGDAARALSSLGTAYRRALTGVRTVAVTGSNGKTTTVRLIHAALRGAGLRGTHALKSHNNDLGVPLTILNARPSDDYLICEVGTNAPGEIAPLAAMVSPDVAVITSIGRSHLEQLVSVAGVADEKADLVRALREGGVGIITGDSPDLDATLTGAPLPVGTALLRVGLAPGCDIPVSAVVSSGGETRCIAAGRALRLPLPGAHNACNAAIAVAAAEAIGADTARAAAGLSDAEGPTMRLERSVLQVDGGVIHLINDAYNANPESVSAAVRMLADGVLDPVGGDANGGRRIAVLGGMLELGDAADAAHAEIVGLVSGLESIDEAVFIGPAYVGAAPGGARRDADRLRFVAGDQGWPAAVARMLHPGDTVLLKGSRGGQLERLIGVLSDE